MDKQTAIDLLDNLIGMVEDNHESDYDTAIHMGIDALKEKMQLSKEDATKDATFDCISRQAAIDEIDEWIKAFRENGHKESAADACLIQDGIIQLPSAQQEIIRCKDCRWGREVCGNIKCFVDSNLPPEYHGYEWFCPNGERRING